MTRVSPVSRRRPAPRSAPITPWAWGLPLPSPNTVSISMPAVMYIMTPASATTVSPGSSSTSTNCRSSPSILKSISWARRPGTGGTGGGGACTARCGLNLSTSLSGVHSLIPAVKTRDVPSTLPFLMLAPISLSATGPTWWPPTAIHHSVMGSLLSSGGGVDRRLRLALQGRHRGRVQAELVGELREVDPLRSRDALVRPHDRERERVELGLERGIRGSGHDLREGAGSRELLGDHGLRPHFPRVLEDRAPLLQAQLAVRARRGHGEADELEHGGGEPPRGRGCLRHRGRDGGREGLRGRRGDAGAILLLVRLVDPPREPGGGEDVLGVDQRPQGALRAPVPLPAAPALERALDQAAEDVFRVHRTSGREDSTPLRTAVGPPPGGAGLPRGAPARAPPARGSAGASPDGRDRRSARRSRGGRPPAPPPRARPATRSPLPR